MTLIELKNIFKKTLIDLYPIEEIDTFFYLFIEYRLNLKRVDVLLNPSQIIITKDISYFSFAIEKLKQEIPIQHIIGDTEFYGLSFKVNKNTLIPRPETEELVSWILEENKNTALKITDIGTGSGCIAITLAKNSPKAIVTAIDISDKALKTAKENNLLNNTTVKFTLKDILRTDKLEVKQNIIVSNPPYVRNLEKKEIKNNVLNNEPHLALFVEDNNALIFYDKIAEIAKNSLTKNGLLFFEINQYLGKETVELLKNKGYKNIELRKDIFGNDRMIKAML